SSAFGTFSPLAGRRKRKLPRSRGVGSSSARGQREEKPAFSFLASVFPSPRARGEGGAQRRMRGHGRGDVRGDARTATRLVSRGDCWITWRRGEKRPSSAFGTFSPLAGRRKKGEPTPLAGRRKGRNPLRS